eukprot:393325_1
MDDIDEMTTFLKNIILIENLFNSVYHPYKRQQEEARAKYAPNLLNYEDKPKVQSEAASFVELIFGGQTHISSFRTWLAKVEKQCEIQNITILKSSGAKVKQIERAFYKAHYVYDEHDGFKEMTDILRCSFVFDNFADLYQCFSVIEMLAEQTLGGILRVKDRYHPTSIPFGYRDLLINVFCPSSKIVAEIQLHFIEFYQYKTISHRMYKRARLFERDAGNLAYEYSSKFLRPKIGTFKVYEVSKEEMQNDDSKEDTAKKAADLTFGELLKEWGFQKYIAAMREQGWEDPADWRDIEDEDLKNDMGFSKGHIKKFKRKYAEWLKQIEQEKRQDVSQEVAVFQEQVYDNKQPQLRLNKQQDQEQKQGSEVYKVGYVSNTRCLSLQGDTMKLTDGGEQCVTLAEPCLLGESALPFTVSFDVEFTAGSNQGVGKHGGIFLGVAKDYALQRWGERGTVNIIDWIDRAQDRGYHVYENVAQRDSSSIWNRKRVAQPQPGKRWMIVYKSVDECQLMVDGELITTFKPVSVSGHIGFWQYNGGISVSNARVSPLSISCMSEPTAVKLSGNALEIASGAEQHCTLLTPALLGESALPFTVSFDVEFTAGSNPGVGKHGGCYLGVASDYFLQRWGERGTVNIIDWIDRAQDRGYHVYENVAQRDSSSIWNRKRIAQPRPGKRWMIVYKSVDECQLMVDGELITTFKPVSVSGHIGFWQYNGSICVSNVMVSPMSISGMSEPNAVKLSTNVLEITHASEQHCTLLTPCLLGKSALPFTVSFDVKFTAGSNSGVGKHGGIYLGVSSDYFLQRWGEKGVVNIIDWIDRAQDRGYHIYENVAQRDSPSAWNRKRVAQPRPGKHWVIKYKSVDECEFIVDEELITTFKPVSVSGHLGLWQYQGSITMSNLQIVAEENDMIMLDGDDTDDMKYEGEGIAIEEFRKGSWDDRITKSLNFINTKLQNKGQLIDIGFTMSNTDWMACIHVYYIKEVKDMKYFKRNPADYAQHGELLCEWSPYASSWMNAAQKAKVFIEKIATSKGKLFAVKHGCGNHAYTHGGAVIATFYWSGIKQNNVNTNGNAVMVAEFRKGSWDGKLKETLQFINTKIANKGQILDIAMTMSNTDWLACVHVYYIKDVDSMSQFQRNPKDYAHRGQLLCEWEQYADSWRKSAGKMKRVVQEKALEGNLVGVKHACGNHAWTHGGATIFVYYYQ